MSDAVEVRLENLETGQKRLDRLMWGFNGEGKGLVEEVHSSTKMLSKIEGDIAEMRAQLGQQQRDIEARLGNIEDEIRYRNADSDRRAKLKAAAINGFFGLMGALVGVIGSVVLGLMQAP